MAEFLTTTAISSELEKIIKGAQGGRLLLISPYLKLNPRIRELLEVQAQRRKTSIYIVCRKTDLETKWLDDNRVFISFRKHLHAKCYMNDSHALVTSMNLYEFSQVNNDEMGILVSVQDDRELYQEIKAEADHILGQSLAARTEPVGKTTQAGSGFCLRCASATPFDLGRPYCNSHYRSWARFKREEYQEKHCHACGKEHGTSKAKPVCLSCYPQYRSVLRATANRS